MTATMAPPEASEKGTSRKLPRPPRLQRKNSRPTRPTRPTTRPVRAGEAEEALSLASSAFTVIALVCGWMLLQMLLLGGVAEQRSQDLLYSTYREQLAAATAPTGALDYKGDPLEPGAPVALLTIPALDLTQVVVSGTSSGDLLDGPGHMRTTSLPGQAGVSVVMGRARTYGGPFGDLGALVPGDHITVQNAQGEVDYTVQDVRQAGDPLPQPLSGKESRLTLVSATGSGFLSGLRAGDAMYVDAVTTKAFPAGPLAGSALPESEQAMAGETAALPVLVLLLAVLALVVLAVSAALRRFRAPLVWVTAMPFVIALAWATTDQVVRLLPNLM